MEEYGGLRSDHTASGAAFGTNPREAIGQGQGQANGALIAQPGPVPFFAASRLLQIGLPSTVRFLPTVGFVGLQTMFDSH
jgi:hypothetical protein